MPFSSACRDEEPSRDEVEQSTGLLLLEFGAAWGGHCQALSATLQEVLGSLPDIHHLRIADGRGKPLGRSFRVKLWPTLILLQEGQVLRELVRPSANELREALKEALKEVPEL